MTTVAVTTRNDGGYGCCHPIFFLPLKKTPNITQGAPMQTPHGFSLIEVIISLTLISITLISISSARVLAVREASHSYLYFAALKQQEMIANALQQTPYQEWQSVYELFNPGLQKILPNGRLSVVQDDNGAKRIIINWGQSEAVNCQQNILDRNGCVSYLLME